MGGDPPPQNASPQPSLPPSTPKNVGFPPPPIEFWWGEWDTMGTVVRWRGVASMLWHPNMWVGRKMGVPPPPQTGVTPNRAHRAPYGVPHLGFPRPRMFMGPLWGLKFRVSPTHHVDGVPTGASPVVSRVGGIGGSWWGWRGSLRGSGGALWGRRPPLAPLFWWPRAQTGCVHGGPLQGAAHCRQRIRILCTLRGQRG